MVKQQIIQDTSVKVDMLMWHVTKLLTRNKKQVLEGFGLTCSQFEMLSATYLFAKNKREAIQIDLSEETGIDPMTTSTILRNLQKKGLITRTRSMINTRTVVVGLTNKGAKLYIEAWAKLDDMCDSLYRNIDKKSLASQLLELSENLNKLNY